MLGLLMPPMAALGTAGPLILRCATDACDDVGRVAGRLYAAGTIGNLLGALLPGLWAVPLLGSGTTMAACGAVLAVVGMGGLVSGRRRWVATGLIGLFAAGTGALLPRAAGAHGEVIHEADSVPNHLTIVEHQGIRRLLVGEGYASQSIYPVDGKLPLYDVWGYGAMAPAWTTTGAPKHVLMLGLGAGTNARNLRLLYPSAHLTGVELDPDIVAAGRKFFDLPASVEVAIDDARHFLSTDLRRWDLVLVDAFQFPYVPFQLVTSEAFLSLKQHLAA